MILILTLFKHKITMSNTDQSINMKQWVEECLRQRANQKGTYEELGQKISVTMQTLAQQMEQGTDPIDTSLAIQAVIRDLSGMNVSEPLRSKRHQMRCNVLQNQHDAAIIRSLMTRLDPMVLRDLTSRTAFYRTLVREIIDNHWINCPLDKLSYNESQRIVLRLLGTSIRPNRLQLGLSEAFKQAKQTIALNIQSPTGSGKTFGVESVLMDSKLNKKHIIIFVPASIETLKQFIAATEQARIPFCIAEMDGTLIANTETLAFGGVKDPVPQTMQELHERLLNRKRGNESSQGKVVQKRREMTRRQRRFIARLRGGVHALYPSVVVAAPWMRWVPDLLLSLVQDVESFGDQHDKTVTLFFDDFMATDQDLLRGIGMVQAMTEARRVCCMSATSASLATADLLNLHRERRGLAKFEDRVYDDNRGLGMRLAVPSVNGLTAWSLLDHCIEAFIDGQNKSPYALATISPNRTFGLLQYMLGDELQARNFVLGTIAQETALSFDLFRRKVVTMLEKLTVSERAAALQAVPPESIVSNTATPNRQWLILDQCPRVRATNRGAKKPNMTIGDANHRWIARLTKAVQDVQQMKAKQREIHTKMIKTRGGDARDMFVPGDTGAVVDFIFPHLHPLFHNNETMIKAILDRADATGTSESDQASCLQHARLTVDQNTASAWVKATLRYAAEIDGTPATMGYGVHLTTLDRVDLPSQPTTKLTTCIDHLIECPDDTVSVAALIQGAGRVGRSKQTGQSLVVAATADAEQFQLMFSPEFRRFQSRLLEYACNQYLPDKLPEPICEVTPAVDLHTPLRPTVDVVPLNQAAKQVIETVESTSNNNFEPDIPDCWDDSDEDAE